MQLFVYKVFKIILFRDFTCIHYNQPINGLLVLYMFTRKSYVIFLPFLYFFLFVDHSFPPNLTVEYNFFSFSFILSFFLSFFIRI